MDHTLVARPGGASPWGGEPAVRAARSCARSSRRLEEGAALTRCWGTTRPPPNPGAPLCPPSLPSPLPRHFLSSRLSPLRGHHRPEVPAGQALPASHR